MKKLLILLLVCGSVSAQKFFEMRVYHLHNGKMPDLQARFKNHTLGLFKKHKIESIGYFVPVKNPDSVLVFVLGYDSHQQRDSSWKTFSADPDWVKARAESEKNGPIVKKVDQYFLNPTDFNMNNYSQEGNRVFELRTYTASKYNLGLLLARFRNHTVALFEKHGMKNIAYWTQEGKDDMLIYLLSHKNQEAQKASFASFVKDQGWIDARAASEKLANGSITSAIKSEFLQALDFSPLK